MFEINSLIKFKIVCFSFSFVSLLRYKSNKKKYIGIFSNEEKYSEIKRFFFISIDKSLMIADFDSWELLEFLRKLKN